MPCQHFFHSASGFRRRSSRALDVPAQRAPQLPPCRLHMAGKRLPRGAFFPDDMPGGDGAVFPEHCAAFTLADIRLLDLFQHEGPQRGVDADVQRIARRPDDRAMEIVIRLDKGLQPVERAASSMISIWARSSPATRSADFCFFLTSVVSRASASRSMISLRSTSSKGPPSPGEWPTSAPPWRYGRNRRRTCPFLSCFPVSRGAGRS